MATDDAVDRKKLDALLERQHGILSLPQATSCGLSRHVVAHRISSGRWARVHPGVFATSTGLLSVDQRIWAAVLYAGPGATVGFRTAWWLADRTLKEPERIDVVIPDARIVQRQAGVRMRRTRRWPPEDLHPTAQPPRFRVERAVLDCAAATRTPDQAVGLLASAVQQRTTTVGRLRETLARHPVLRRRKLLYEVLALAEGGAETLIEVAHARITAAHGLPEPERQRRIGDAVTDAAYDCPDGSVLVAEFDGRLAHLTADG